MKNVIVFGSQKIAIDCIEILRNTQDIKLLCVVGSEMPSDKLYGYHSISEFCQKENLKYYSPDKLDTSFIYNLKKLNPNLCFSFYYRKIFKEELINLPSEGFINIHPSLLPKYRGPVPSMWALLNGDPETGVTLHYIGKGIDSGDIIAQKKVKIDPTISGFELHNKLMEKGASLFQKTLLAILSNKITRTKQKQKDATYYGPFKPSVQYIDWYAETKDIYNKVRTFKKPYLGAKGIIDGKEIIIWSAEETSYSKRNLSGPGKIVHVKSDNTFIASTVDGHLLIKEYEFKEKDSMWQYIYVGSTFSL